MSYSDYALIKKDTLTDIGNAIRAQKGTSDLIDPADFSSEIESIEGGTIVEGHAEVDSIITDGACYINTNICPNPNYSIEMKCRLHTIVDDRFDFFFGTRNGTYARWQARFDVLEDSTAPNQLRVQRSTANDVAGSWYTSSQTKQDWMNTFRVLKLAKNKVYIDGVLQYTFDSTSTKEHYLYPVYLFSCNDKYSEASVLSGYGHLECEYAKMWNEDDELILDLVPVVKNDGTVCMYNKVNGAYYYNEGTGEFTYSGEPKQDIVMYELQEKTVSENGEVTPDEGYYGLSKVTVNVPTGSVMEHTEVESLITDGLSYINTHISPNPNYSIEMEFKLTEAGLTEDGQWDYLFGTRRSGYTSSLEVRFDNNTSDSCPLLVTRSNNTTTTSTPENISSGAAGVKADYAVFKTFKLLKNKLYIDENLIHTYATAANSEHYLFPLYLFAVNSAGVTYKTNMGRLEVRYVKMWDDNDNLVLDLIPVIKHDNTICMYNQVNGTYYYNSGTGKFSAKVNFVIGNTLYLRSEGGVKIPTGCTTSGNYVDCEGQEWLYNTVDLTTNTKTQYVSSMVLDGSESWGRNTTTLDGNTYYDFYSVSPHDVQNYIKTVGTNDIGHIYIEGFRVWSQYNINNNYYTEDRLRSGFVNSTAMLYTGSTGANAYLNMIDRDCMTMTVDEWKAHLAAHPKTVYYVLRTSVTSTLTDEEVELLIDPTASPEPEEPSTPEVVSDALIDIDMINGTNKGIGGSTYDAVNNNGTFTDGKFVLDTPGCLTVPTEFMAESSTKSWTVAFTIDDYSVGSNKYSRIARGNNDVPSIFWCEEKSFKGFWQKLASASSRDTAYTARTCGTTWYDSDFFFVDEAQGIRFVDFKGRKRTFVFRNDGVNIEMFVDGSKKCTASANVYTSEYWASTFSVGNDEYSNDASYNMNNLECSMLKLWDKALSDSEIITLSSNVTVVSAEEYIYNYYGIDKEEYPYLYVASWYNSSKNWRIKPIFAKSINDETGVITDVLGLQEATTKLLTDDEYNNASYYSNTNTVFDYMKQSNITFNNSYDSYQTDNILDKCWYFTNWDATYYTNWSDLRTMYI